MNHQIFNYKIFFLLMMICGCAGISTFTSHSNLFILIALSIAFLLIFLSDGLNTLYLAFALIPFYSVLCFNNVSFSFLIPLLSILKIFYDKKGEMLNFYSIFSLFFLSIWLLNDLQYQSLLRTIARLSTPAYILLCIYLLDFRKYNGHYAAIIVFFSTIIAMISVYITQGINISEFQDAQYAGEFRLGERTSSGDTILLGGAMGYPIYTLTILTLTYQFFCFQKLENKKRIIYFLISLFAFLITFFTISRVYLLGLLVFISVILYHYFRRNIIKFFLTISISFLLIFVITNIALPDFSNFIYDQYLGRIDGDSKGGMSGIRGRIYDDCIEHFISSVKCFFIGEGNTGYTQIGYQKSNLMSFSAHNIFLDALLSYGVLGTLYLFCFFIGLYKHASRRCILNAKAIRFLPLVCILVMYCTASPFTTQKFWPLMTFLVLNLARCSDSLITKQKTHSI